METEYIYWRHTTPVGIRVEEVSGAEQRSGKIWLQLAYQVYLENGREGYRYLEHTESGAPYLDNEMFRISITHTKGLLAVASLPKTPDADLTQFSARTALGIDAEREDRDQVIKLRERFLSEKELELIPADDLRANILAWTAKEALYKAALSEGIDWRKDLRIKKLPTLLQYVESEKGEPEALFEVGKANMRRCDGKDYDMELFAYSSESCIVTIAYSPKCAKYHSKG